jgi:hypothetical protein
VLALHQHISPIDDNYKDMEGLARHIGEIPGLGRVLSNVSPFWVVLNSCYFKGMLLEKGCVIFSPSFPNVLISSFDRELDRLMEKSPHPSWRRAGTFKDALLILIFQGNKSAAEALSVELASLSLSSRGGTPKKLPPTCTYHTLQIACCINYLSSYYR